MSNMIISKINQWEMHFKMFHRWAIMVELHTTKEPTFKVHFDNFQISLFLDKELAIAECKAYVEEAKYEVRVGHYVRSYDFAHTTDSYVEGFVTDIMKSGDGYSMYKILAMKRKFGEEPQLFTSPLYFAPPVNGTPKSTGGTTKGVIVLVG